MNTRNSTRIRVLPTQALLQVECKGLFDKGLGRFVWEAAQVERQVYPSFVFDLSELVTLRDSGLAWLLMLQRYCLRHKRQLSVVVAESSLAARCQRAGLDITFTLAPERRADNDPLALPVEAAPPLSTALAG